MRGEVLTSIQKFHPPLVPPNGAVVAGVTPDGQQLYRRSTKRSGSKPRIDPKSITVENPEGEQLWKKQPVTGEPLYKMREVTFWTEERLFFLHSIGNGNVEMVDYVPPDPAEIDRAQRRQDAQSRLQELTEAMVDQDMSAAELIAYIQTQRTAPVQEPVPAPAPPTAEDNLTFPVSIRPGGHYRLSNGAEFAGKKVDAEAAQALMDTDLAEAKATAASTPEI